MLQRIRELPDQGLYGVVGVLAVAALYVIGFVIKNSKHVSVDFVLFSAGVPLITLMVVMLLFGALLGVVLTLLLARRRAPKAAGTVRRRASQPSKPPPVERRRSHRSAGTWYSQPPRRGRESTSHHPRRVAPPPLAARVDLVGTRRPHAEVAQDAVVQAVDDAVHLSRCAAVPGLLHDRRAADVRDLLHDVEPAQQVGQSRRRRRPSRLACSWATSWTWRSQLSISPCRRPSSAASTPPQPRWPQTMTCSTPQHLDRVLQHRQAVEVGVHDDVGDVAVHEDLAGVGAGDLVRRHPAVGAADPEVARRLLGREPPEEPGSRSTTSAGPLAVAAAGCRRAAWPSLGR